MRRKWEKREDGPLRHEEISSLLNTSFVKRNAPLENYFIYSDNIFTAFLRHVAIIIGKLGLGNKEKMLVNIPL